MGFYGGLKYILAIPVCFLTPRIFPKTPYKVIITACLFMISIACMIRGPSLIFNLPEKLWVFTTGLILSGCVTSPLFVVNISDIYLTLKTKNKIIDGKNPRFDFILANYISSLAVVFYSLGPIIFRRIGAGLFSKYGFRVENDIFMSFYFLLSIVYFIFY